MSQQPVTLTREAAQLAAVALHLSATSCAVEAFHASKAGNRTAADFHLLSCERYKAAAKTIEEQMR